MIIECRTTMGSPCLVNTNRITYATEHATKKGEWTFVLSGVPTPLHLRLTDEQVKRMQAG